MRPEVLVEPDPELNQLSEVVIGAMIEVHRNLGPGYNERTYKESLKIEFDLRGIPYVKEAEFRVLYKGQVVGKRRLDFLVAGRLILEIKAVEAILPIHKAQVIGYLTMMKLQLALLVNFNVRAMKDGIKRIVLSHQDSE